MQIIVDTKKDSVQDIQLAVRLLKTVLNVQYGVDLDADNAVSIHQTPFDFDSALAQLKSLSEVGTVVQSAPVVPADLTSTDTQAADSTVSLPNTGEHHYRSPPLTGEPAGVPTPPTLTVVVDEAHHVRGFTPEYSAADFIPGEKDRNGPIPDRLPAVPSLAVDADTDSAGQKWDAAIHSETRSKVADGTWRKRRNAKGVVSTTAPVAVAPAVDTVPVPPAPITRLHGDLAVPTPPSTVLPHPLSTDTGPAPVNTVANEQTQAVVPLIKGVSHVHDMNQNTVVYGSMINANTPQYTGIPSPPAAAFVPVNTFQELMVKVAQLMAARSITSKDVADVCAMHGINSFQECFTNTALVPSVHTALNSIAVKVGV